MRKLLSILLFVVLISTGCNSNYSIEKITIDNELPLHMYYYNKGFHISEVKENEYNLVISLGEERLRGYNATIKDIIEKNGEIIIIIDEVKTATPDIYSLFRIKGKIDNINNVKVENKQGERLLLIDSATGTVVSYTNEGFINIQIAEEIKKFYIIDIVDYFYSLNISNGDRVNITYLKTENGQFIVKGIVREYDSPIIKEVEGTYLNQIDESAIEVKVNEKNQKYSIFYISKQFHALNLTNGDNIRLSYIVEPTNNNLLFIKFIEKINSP